MARKQSSKKKQPDVVRRFLKLGEDEDRVWNVVRSDTELMTAWGALDGPLQSRSKGFDSVEDAQKDLEKRVREKLKQGYAELVPHNPDATQQALEDALAFDPDDIGAHSAYADYLHEQGDPKGEYLQLVLALEDESLKTTQRKKLEREANQLFELHRVQWFGELIIPLHVSDTISYDLSRGWLDRLVFSDFDLAQARAVAQSSHIRLLRELVITGVNFEQKQKYGPHGLLAIQELYDCPHLKNVRRLQLGADDVLPNEMILEEKHVVGLIQNMPRLEHLVVIVQVRLNTQSLCAFQYPSTLKNLQLGGNVELAVEKLVKNSTLSSLETLRLEPDYTYQDPEDPARLDLDDLTAICHSPHLQNVKHLSLWRSSVGDAGIEELISSGMLERLESLDLCYGCVTDAGALRLAEVMNPAKLTSLCLNANAIDELGGQALLEILPETKLNDQHDVEDDSWRLGEYAQYEDEYDDEWE